MKMAYTLERGAECKLEDSEVLLPLELERKKKERKREREKVAC